MAPKRKAKVVRTTRKVVQESVEVTLVENDQKLAAEAENGVQMRQQESESEVVETTLTVEDESVGGANREAVEIPIKEPPHKETAAAATEAPRTPKQPGAEGKTQDQKRTRQAKKKDSEEREEEVETQSPEDTPRPEAEKETGTFDGEREKAQETEKERPPEKDVEAKDKPKRAREADEKATGEQRRRRRRRRVGEGGGEEQYKRYVFRVLKQVHPGLGISSAAMEVLNGYMNDMFERLASESARLSSYAGIKTLSSRDVQGAVRLVLPGELGRHAIAEGAKALTNYMEHGGGAGGSESSDAKSKS